MAKTTRPKSKAYRLAQNLMTQFQAHHGAINCRDLIGFELHTAEGYKKAAEAGVFRKICPELVRDAARMVEELLSKG